MSLSSPQHKHPTPLPSPNSSSSSTTNPNPTLTRSDPSNPYPTTFVQADISSFKQVVQMLTGSSIPIPIPKPASNSTHTPPINNKSKPSTKLYERRNHSFKHHLRPLNSHMKPSHDTNNNSPHGCGLLLSPSMLDFPGLMLSPVTPLIHDPFNRSPVNNKLAEEKAIAQKGFFLHPVSPVSTEPRLLPLFPVTSPKVSSDSSSSSSDQCLN